MATQVLPSKDLKSNLLLAALTSAERGRWSSDLEFVELPLGLVLAESNQTMSYVYFPTTAIVSLLYVMDTGASAEVAVVGNEGIVGISLFMGGLGDEPDRGAKRWPRIPASGDGAEGGVRARRTCHAPAVALHASAHCADVANRRMQPPSLATNSCAAGFCSAWTGWRATSW